MMKNLKEVFLECLVMLRKCKEGVTKGDQACVWWDTWQVGKRGMGGTA